MAFQVLQQVEEAAGFGEEVRRAGKRLAMVPTMGFLHEGHLSLMRAGRQRADVVLTSIFVNPKQFGPREDLARYPRDLEGDLAKCRGAGVDAVFVPEVDAMYPPGFQTHVEVTELSRGLCGDHRPGHFRGVATVVTKLLLIPRPHVALFGEKDYQQLQVIRALVRDLNLGVEVLGIPTVREADGLAMSSRNAYLSPDERTRARSLYRGLDAARRLFLEGERAAGPLLSAVRSELVAAQVREDYVELVDAATLTPLPRIPSEGSARLLVAGFVGTTRLIDNIGL